MTDVAAPKRVAITPAARRILDAASRLFYDKGIHAVGVDLIAAESGVTKKTLYDRFGSKDQLVTEYLLTRDEAWRAFLGDRLARVVDDPVERLAEIFNVARDWMDAKSPRGCSMVNAHAEITDPQHPAFRIMADQKRWMLELFISSARDCGVAEPEAVGELLMLLHEGALVAHGMSIFADPIGRASAEARRLVGA
ncbi:helix-turn-helix domain-containing protein [Saxibacter everestensis]|uniref:Helix-turn-helix domain-containing protein n=1 Tax=Saxibacter everestensis TaxID=2909229 RepID=A0ABY8QV69_9MICO|nr:helix-turn-helix domain-containing protein [Brevibacteriaceae bacterium ZFBP1038]